MGVAREGSMSKHIDSDAWDPPRGGKESVVTTPRSLQWNVSWSWVFGSPQKYEQERFSRVDKLRDDRPKNVLYD